LSFLSNVLRSKKKVFFTVALLVLLLDQTAKVAFWRAPEDGSSALVIIPHILQFVPHEGNQRGAMGLGPKSRMFYVTAAVVGLIIIRMFYATTPSRKSLVHGALGMLAGGAVGNLVDRLLWGRVRDFIDLHWGDAYHWHTFNVADSAICVGFLLIVLDAFFSKDQPVRPARRRRSGPNDVRAGRRKTG
jgi:signal peptidase II